MPPIYHISQQRLDLTRYGIQIPLMVSRAEKVFAYLQASFPHAPPSRWAHLLEDNRLTAQDLLRVHTPSYVAELLSDRPDPAIEVAYELFDAAGRPHRYDPDSAQAPLREIVQRALVEASGTLTAAEGALEEGVAYFLGGGMHHALATHGRGFCLIHDVLVAARALQASGRVGRVWVVDTDAHKGDGTAALTVGDRSILTLSIHMARGWPLDGHPLGTDGALLPWHWPSTVDKPVPVGGEGSYLRQLGQGLEELELLSEGEAPDLCFVVAGSDPYVGDTLPSASGLRLGLHQLLERDTLVYEFLARRRIPQVWVMAGGYGPEVWKVHAGAAHFIVARWLERLVFQAP